MTEAEKQAQLATLQEQRRKLVRTIEDADDELVLAREARYEALQFYARLIREDRLPELTTDVMDEIRLLQQSLAWYTDEQVRDPFGDEGLQPQEEIGTPIWKWMARSDVLEWCQEKLTAAINAIKLWTARLTAWRKQLDDLDEQINALDAELQRQLDTKAAEQPPTPTEPATPTPAPPMPTPTPPTPAPKTEEKKRTLEKIYGASKRSRTKK